MKKPYLILIALKTSDLAITARIFAHVKAQFDPQAQAHWQSKDSAGIFVFTERSANEMHRSLARHIQAQPAGLEFDAPVVLELSKDHSTAADSRLWGWLNSKATHSPHSPSQAGNT